MPRPHLSTLRPCQAAASSGILHLCTAIGQRYKLDRDSIICGAGSEELIDPIAQAYAEPNEEVLFTRYGFIKYELAARVHGAVPVRAPERAFTADADALIAGVGPATRIVFPANPNNPMGTCIDDRQVRRLRAGLHSDILLFIDAAHAEFVESHDYSDGLPIARETQNTLALRTFFKIHGLAGLRCGWGFGDRALIDSLHKVRGAFDVNAVAQAAAAAAIQDDAHEQQARTHNTREMAWLTGRFADAGISFIPSVCNFVVVRFGSADRCQAALRALAEAGVLVMPLTGHGLPESMRVTCGTRAANEAVLHALLRAHHAST